ncbi:hypothetical protein QFC21_003709 [Naganishia friedmannii]|uniref:Uncharacterized protein n=1 Tax=Naganishia friedmannii TaxID=89922 RepID=A0ACC2VNU0_9TREE|nr:hypothetical protein QFC21_003709 [Naganishia friedmannii]
MLRSSCSLIKQASQRSSAQLGAQVNTSRALSTSAGRLADHAKDNSQSKLSRMQELLLEIPPELNIPGLNAKSGREQTEKKQQKHFDKRSSGTLQGHGKGGYRSSPPPDPYALLQNIRLPRPEKTPRLNDNSRAKRADGQSEGKRTRTEGGERQSRGPRAPSQTGENGEPRQAARGDRNNGPRAESSRQPQKDRAPRPPRELSAHKFDAPARKSELAPIVRAAPTVEELFGDSSMLSEQSRVGNEVFEGSVLNDGEGSSKHTTSITNLSLLPPSPVVPQSLSKTTPRQQVHEFAVLQADYTLSRNPNVSLDQRGQAIGLVKQRLGA